jgi:RNA polymerase sigma factor (sigma-70 family)
LSLADRSSDDVIRETPSTSIQPDRAYEAYVDRLIALARHRLSKKYQSKIDPKDVVQSVFRTYVRRAADGSLASNDWDSLWSLLARITVRKCLKQVRYHGRAKRDLNRESDLGDDHSAISNLLDKAPTQIDAAIMEEEFDLLMQGLTSEQQQIVALKMQNFTNQEIAEIIGRTERTVYRILDLIRQKLAEREQQTP